MNDREQYVSGLRQLADWLEAHPEVPTPWSGNEYDPIQVAVWTSKEELAAIAKAMPGTVSKTFSDQTMRINSQFGAIHVSAYAGRDEVCERVVVGTETVVVPAVEAKPERVEEREVVEWRCHPLLADETADKHAEAAAS